MKQITLLLTVFILSINNALGQNATIYKIDFTDPKSVVNSIFYAAQSNDLSILQCLCDPYGDGDGDTKNLCALLKNSTEVQNNSINQTNSMSIEGFIKVFRAGSINGQVTYEQTGDTKHAKVPIHIEHPGGESRSNEIMNLVYRHGNWYLSSF